MSEAWIVVDLGFGDQGKGTVTDFLVRDRGARTVVRYNGGAQAGHNVVTGDGRHHTFAQFGAGTFVPGVRTFLGAQVVVQPWAMVVEAEHLARAGVPDAFERTRVHAAARVVTPFHRAANRLRERARGEARHGSCGVGIGEAVRDSIERPDLVVRVGDLFDTAGLRAKLRRVQEHRRAELREMSGEDLAELSDPAAADFWIERLAPFRAHARLGGDDDLAAWLAEGPAVFEGAQGVLLDERHGFHPYTTWSDCTATHALAALDAFDGPVVTLGVVRAYATRHGPGPFPTEDAALTARLPDPHNGRHPWQGAFRVGWFDAVATRYALRACRVDALAVTCVDRLDAWRLATHYALDGAVVRDLEGETGRWFRVRPVYGGEVGLEAHLAAIADETGVPIRLRSAGPTAADKAWVTA